MAAAPAAAERAERAAYIRPDSFAGIPREMEPSSRGSMFGITVTQDTITAAYREVPRCVRAVSAHEFGARVEGPHA